MFTSSQFPQISLPEIFKQLSAGATLVTPNRRLTLTLKSSFDTDQVRQKKTAWPSADILPLSAFIKRIYRDILYTGQTQIPTLLTPVQEQILWESAIQNSEDGRTLLTISQTAQWVREAWQLAHAWQLFPQLEQFPLNEDGTAFQAWYQHYQHVTQQAEQVDEARLSDLLVALLEQPLNITIPTHLICYGFDVLTPQQRTFLNKLTAVDCVVSQCSPSSTVDSVDNQNIPDKHIGRIEYASSDEEIYQAATWARARIESNPSAQIGIVVPELSKHRAAILRIFHSIMIPDVKLASPESDNTTLHAVPFNISLGQPLTHYPLIDAAFIILELVYREVPFAHVSRLLRAPILAGGETEISQRAQLDAQLRQHVEPSITLHQLLMLIHTISGEATCPGLVQCFSLMTEFKTQLTQKNCHTGLAMMMMDILNAIGFPGERALNSTEYQTLKKWQSLLAEFATLDHIQSECHYGEALSRLHRMASSTLFQPETPDVPIQILGILEAAGMTFDHLWVMGLSDEVWPLRARINPFLPATVQRQARLPLGSTLAANAYSTQFTNGWLSSADEVILSHPAFSDERDGHALQPSPLIKDIEPIQLTIPTYTSHQDTIIQHIKLESYVDDHDTPIYDTTGIQGGTNVIKDYAACPFRAWAKHRLNITNLRSPHTGLDAMERGSLIHHVLAQLWSQLKAKSTLDTTSEEELKKILQQAADRAIKQMQRNRPTALSGSFAMIENRRLIHLAHEWLDIEKQRSHFTVIAAEEKRSIEIAGLELNTRLDRIDELENGDRIIIDYKTGQQTTKAMIGERLDEPQLPLYLVMTEPDAVAVAFAQIRPSAMKFEAITRDENILPGIKAFSASPLQAEFDTWATLVKTWQTDLIALVKGFLSGDTQVFPKQYPDTCRHCDMKPFCRIHERISVTPTQSVQQK